MIPPERIGRYRLMGEIGRGAMGAVYRAHDPQLQRDVVNVDNELEEIQ